VGVRRRRRVSGTHMYITPPQYDSTWVQITHMWVGLHIGEWYPDAYHTTTRATATLCLCLRTPTSRTDRQHKQGGGKPNTRLRSCEETSFPRGGRFRRTLLYGMVFYTCLMLFRLKSSFLANFSSAPWTYSSLERM
jgi:hypothetical protein